MADIEQKVTRTEGDAVTDTGKVIRESTTSSESSVGAKTTAVNFIWYIDGLVTLLLGMRMLLKLLGANVGNGFVDFIYSVSGVLSAPFDNIFGVASATAGSTRSVFEPSILVAIAVYAGIAWGISKLFSLNQRA